MAVLEVRNSVRVRSLAMPWWLWALLGVLALAGEAISMALFLLYVAIAAFVAALLALLHINVAAQVGVFVVLSVLLVGLVRPRMLHALAGRVPHRALTNQGRLVDRLATVTQAVTPSGGTVRVGNAEFWTARVTPPPRASRWAAACTSSTSTGSPPMSSSWSPFPRWRLRQ